MAFTVSRTRICPMQAKVEATYGADPTIAPADDGLLAYDSATPISIDVTKFELRPHGASFTHRKDIIAQRLGKLRFRCMFMGSGTPGDEAVAGFKGLSALLQGCGMKFTDATTPDRLTYAPATVAQLKSVYIQINMNGVVHTLAGAYGNATFSGDTRGGNAIDFEFTGLYSAPALDPVGSEVIFASWAGGGQRALPWLGLTSSKIHSATLDYTAVLKSYRFSMGSVIEPIEDANSATGLFGLVYADRNPTLNVVIGLDTQAAGANILDYPQIYADLFASTTHEITWTQGAGADGNTITQSFPTAQLVNVTPQATGAHRSMSLDYKVQHATDETEFLFTIA